MALYDELGLTQLSRQIEATTDDIIAAEDYFRECDDDSPNIVAGRLMIGLSNDCQRDSIADGTAIAAPWQWLSLLCKGWFRACLA